MFNADISFRFLCFFDLCYLMVVLCLKPIVVDGYYLFLPLLLTSFFNFYIAQVPGTTQDHLQIFNIEAKAKLKSHQMPEQVSIEENLFVT